MKTIRLLLLANLIMGCSIASAQTITDIMDQTKDQREKEWGEKDERGVKLGFFGHYFLSPSSKIQGNSAFFMSVGGGLKLFIPAFTSGDGTNMGDITGDITISAGYTSWSGDFLPNSTQNYPDWNAFSGLVGFRLGLLGIFFIEPQAGYTYGTYKNQLFKYTPSDVSGLTYGAHAGLTILKGFDVYLLGQATVTKQFGSPFDLGVGMDIHL